MTIVSIIMSILISFFVVVTALVVIGVVQRAPLRRWVKVQTEKEKDREMRIEQRGIEFSLECEIRWHPGVMTQRKKIYLTRLHNLATKRRRLGRRIEKLQRLEER